MQSAASLIKMSLEAALSHAGIGGPAASAGSFRFDTPGSETTWLELYHRASEGVASQSPQWAAAVATAGKFRSTPQFYEFAGGGRAVLPLFTRGVGPLSYAWSPPPAWGFGGTLSDGELTPAQLDTVLAHLETLPCLGIKIRPNPLAAGLWAAAVRPAWTVIPRLAHVVDLSGGFETVHDRFHPDARANIRRAQRRGVYVEVGNSEGLIDEFYRLLKLSFVRWAGKQNEPAALALFRGTRRDPRSKFGAMAAHMGDRFRLYIARVDGQAAAAILVLTGRQAHYTRGAMDEALAGETRATYLLQATAIEDACRLGSTHYHMGETGNSTSLARFKSRFGAVAVPYAEYRYERIPLSQFDEFARAAAKRILRFRDAS
jgi:hypothetical protein